MRKYLIFFLLSGAAFAADCPVRLKLFNSFAPTGNAMYVDYENASDKTLQAVEFHVVTYDAMNDAHDMFENEIDQKKLEPGKGHKAYFSRPDLITRGNSQGGAEVYVKKALFVDGSSWLDDGSHQCLIGDNIRKKHTK